MLGILRYRAWLDPAGFYGPDRDRIATLKTQSPEPNKRLRRFGVWIHASFRFRLNLKKLWLLLRRSF